MEVEGYWLQLSTVKGISYIRFRGGGGGLNLLFISGLAYKRSGLTPKIYEATFKLGVLPMRMLLTKGVVVQVSIKSCFLPCSGWALS